MRPQLDYAQMQVVIDRGDAAKDLMSNKAFLDVIDDLSNYHLSALVAAPVGPAGAEAREHHHTMHSALREIATEITSRVAAADEVRAHLKMLEEEEDL